MSASVTVEAKLLKAAALFASKDETRAHLAGVHVTSDSIEATDGHAIIRIDTSSGGDRLGGNYDAVVPSEVIKVVTAGKMTQVECNSSVIGKDKNGVLVAQSAPLPRGMEFPDASKVIPKPGKVITCINPEFLIRAGRVAKMVGCLHLSIDQPGGEMEPVRLEGTARNGQPVVIAIMPMRG